MRRSQIMLVLVAGTWLMILFSSDSGSWNETKNGNRVIETNKKILEDTENKINLKLSDRDGRFASLQGIDDGQKRTFKMETRVDADKTSQDATAHLRIPSNPNIIGYKPRHVMFSYRFNKGNSNPNGLEEIIAQNSRLAALSLPRTVVLYMDDRNRAIGNNQYGSPVLRDMFIHALMVIPDADTYTYFHPDLIFNKSFVETMDALVYAARRDKINSKFFAVGRRTNVDWDENMIIDQEMTSWDFETVFKSGVRWEDDPEDYFTVSPNIWDWNTIPRFVIGRNKYDNYLVHRAVLSNEVENITTIEMSDTLGVIHQQKTTGSSNNYLRGQQRISHRDINSTMNSDISRHVSIEECKYVSYWDSNGHVQIRPR